MLGWEPQVELDDGLEKTIAWYRAEDARIRLGWPDVGERELAEVAEVLESGHAHDGPEGAPSSRPSSRAACEVEHALAVSSGTAALHLAVLALGLEPGDEVLVPAYTFPATANVVALAGLRPVLVDVDPETMNIDPAKIEVGAAHEGAARRASLRPAGAGSRSCPTAAAARGRGRRARCALPRPRVRQPRPRSAASASTRARS